MSDEITIEELPLSDAEKDFWSGKNHSKILDDFARKAQESPLQKSQNHAGTWSVTGCGWFCLGLSSEQKANEVLEILQEAKDD